MECVIESSEFAARIYGNMSIALTVNISFKQTMDSARDSAWNVS